MSTTPSNSDKREERHTPLQQQADLVCHALNAVPHGFAVLTVEGRVVAANRTLKRWAGDELDPGERSTSAPSRGPALQGFCLSQRSELRAAVARAAQGESFCYEADQLELVPDARGTFSVQVSPWILDGNNVAVCLFVHDVTDELGSRDRASELSFRQLFDAVPDALLVVRGSVVLYSNRSSCTLLGYDWQDELAGRSLYDIVSQDGRDLAADAFADQAVPVAVRRRDGSTACATMARARLMIDDVPTTVVALRPLPPTVEPAGTAPAESLSAIRRALLDAQAALDRARRAAAEAGPTLPHLDDVELAARRAVRAVNGLADRLGVSFAPDSQLLASEASSEAGAQYGEFPTPTVLVCDDESRLAMLTAGLLDQYGFGAITVATGTDALAQLDRGGCDVMLLDMNLPDGSADLVISRMKKRGLAIPVILTSGYAAEDVDPKLMGDELVSSYLPKPYSVDLLVQAIRAAMGERGRTANR